DCIDVCLESVFKESVDEHRFILRDAGGTLEVLRERALVVNDLHGAPTEHVRRPHQHRVSDPLRCFDRFVEAGRGAVLGLPDSETSRDCVEPPAILGDVDRVRLGAEYADAGAGEAAGELERSLSAELNYHTEW